MISWKLIISWLFLIYADFSFALIELVPWVWGLFLKDELTEPIGVPRNAVSMWVTFGVFQLFVVLAFWAHLKTFLADPGFIPYEYTYNIRRMSPANVSLFNYITVERERDAQE